MPIRRAPTRLMAVARSALPMMERSKNTYIAASSTTAAPITTSDWPLTGKPPRSQRASHIVAVRAPSAPKKYKPSPTMTQCSATDTISSISTLACASGRYTSRYSSGPMGTISSSASTVCAQAAAGLTHSATAAATAGSTMAHTAVDPQSTCKPRQCRHASTTRVSTARPNSNQMAEGTPPAWMAAIDSAA